VAYLCRHFDSLFDSLEPPLLPRAALHSPAIETSSRWSGKQNEKYFPFDCLGKYLFYDVRHAPDGTPKPHPLNEERFSEAGILISGINFGCGSSREHAPQALSKAGFRAVIAQSYAEIFFGNCATLGMPCVIASASDIETLATAVNAEPTIEVTIDVEGQKVSFGTQSFPVQIPSTARDAFLSGQWDPIGELLDGIPEIDTTAGKLAYMSR